jgi:hypothetical protein
MASDEKKHLESLLKPLLKEQGFTKRGGTWWRSYNGFTQVVNIQGSQWSKKFYLNLGLYIESLGDKERPTEADCHIRNRLEHLCGPETGILDLLNYSDFPPEEQPRERLIELLRTRGLPWLNKCSDQTVAKEEYKLPNRVMTKWQREQLDKHFAQQEAEADAGKPGAA